MAGRIDLVEEERRRNAQAVAPQATSGASVRHRYLYPSPWRNHSLKYNLRHLFPVRWERLYRMWGPPRCRPHL